MRRSDQESRKLKSGEDWVEWRWLDGEEIERILGLGIL